MLDLLVGVCLVFLWLLLSLLGGGRVGRLSFVDLLIVLIVWFLLLCGVFTGWIIWLLELWSCIDCCFVVLLFAAGFAICALDYCSFMLVCVFVCLWLLMLFDLLV